MQSIDYYVSPGGHLQGSIRVPGDKSISHRALILAAIAEGKSYISGFLQGEDTLATLHALQAMGIETDLHNGQLVITGSGLRGLRAPAGELDLGNSGTAARILSGVLAGQSFDSQITGDESLRQRPMQRIVEPLRRMQAVIESSESGTLPIRITGGQDLQGIEYPMPVASAQVKSCLLLAGLYASGRTCIQEPVATRDHTERLLQFFGCELQLHEHRVCLEGGQRLQGRDVHVPADLSSAAFFMVGASIAEGSDILLQEVGINPTRLAVIPILQSMGADISLQNRDSGSGEPVADIHVRSAHLRGVTIPQEQVAIAIDEFPAIMVAAACAEGTTVLHGAGELRHKESDRIESIAAGMRNLGIHVETFADGIAVTGGALRGGTVDSFGDHRIAMAFAMAGLRASVPLRISNCANVNTSFPGYVQLAAKAGLGIREGGPQ